jgi:hypothetical protein
MTGILQPLIDELVSMGIFSDHQSETNAYTCMCGTVVNRYSVRKHLKSQKHLSVVEHNPEIQRQTIGQLIEESLTNHIISETVKKNYYDCICGSKNISKAYLRKHFESQRHQKITKSEDRVCHICQDESRREFWTCDNCTNIVCVTCHHHITNTSAKCPFCRDPWTVSRELPQLDIPFANQWIYDEGQWTEWRDGFQIHERFQEEESEGEGDYEIQPRYDNDDEDNSHIPRYNPDYEDEQDDNNEEGYDYVEAHSRNRLQLNYDNVFQYSLPMMLEYHIPIFWSDHIRAWAEHFPHRIQHRVDNLRMVLEILEEYNNI